MQPFLGPRFLLTTETAAAVFEQAAAHTPIFDWHCHLSAQEIYEDRAPEDLAALWLGGDHYKWRAMRSCGVPEHLITGEAPGYEKFRAWASTLPNLIGNPLYHWTHLELKRYFDIDTPLKPATAEEIWRKAGQAIQNGGFTPRALIEKSNVTHLCTTDDPADPLTYHRLLQKENLPFRVLPAFRPDRSLAADKPDFPQYIEELSRVAHKPIQTFEDLTGVLGERIALFDALGCRASDHSLSRAPYYPTRTKIVESVFQQALGGEPIMDKQLEAYQTALLHFLAGEYARRGWVMELHLGPMRNNNTRAFERLGPDTGFDSIGDRPQAKSLSGLLNSLARTDALPRTVLFNLNPRDNYVLGTMLGNFQSGEAFGKMQFGAAWWFNDHIDGMREQLRAYGNLGALGTFIGMVTDSRSFLSYPRHEYFRRVLCGLIGEWVEQGWYPADEETLNALVRGISYDNAMKYFGLSAGSESDA